MRCIGVLEQGLVEKGRGYWSLAALLGNSEEHGTWVAVVRGFEQMTCLYIEE